jgi:hypothetical protein
MPKLSIIIPHKPTPSNDKALMLALRSIVECTTQQGILVSIQTHLIG